MKKTLLLIFLTYTAIYSENKDHKKDYDILKSDRYYNLGITKRKDNFQGAIRDFTRAIKLNPKHFRAYYFRGIAKGDLKDFYGAIKDFTKVIKLNPKNLKKNHIAMTYVLRGILKIRLRKRKSACLDLSRAGELGYVKAYRFIKQFCMR